MNNGALCALSWVVILVSPHIHCAGEQNNFSATEWLFRHIVLAEPQAEHPNLCAWNIDSTKTAAAIACVDKEWNALHKKYIAEPRKAFMQTHQENFDAVHLSSSLFNRYTQFCCLVSENKYIKALFGTVSQLNVIAIRLWQYGTPEAEHISSTMITYYNAQQQKIVAPAFQMILKPTTKTPQACVILPDEKQCYTLKFISFTDITFDITAYALTLNKLIQATFDLSEDPSFWNYRYKKDSICVQRELTDTIIDIYPHHNYFKPICSNLFELNRLQKCFESNSSCSCDTNYIDTACREQYETVCDILAKEGASHRKKYLLEPFFERHIRHKIGCIQVDGHTKTIYINPYGELYTRSLSNNTGSYSRIQSKYHNAVDTPSINESQKMAAIHTAKWHIAGNLVFKNSERGGDQQITYLLWHHYGQHNLTIKKNFAIIDGTTVNYSDHFITIFVLQQSDSMLHLPRLLFYHLADKKIEHHALNQTALKKGLAYLLREKKNKLYEVTAPEDDIAAFMQFIKGLANPITNIKNIYPSEDFYAKRPFLIL